ncbi:MAG: hypothetical protein ACKVWR_21260 [Acidimicrobiales bacterium]
MSHYVLDGGRLVVAHAGLPEAMQGRSSERVRSFALYGETTGESDEFGGVVRHDWAADYRGAATVVYGHTAVVEADWAGRTICIDTGCVFGGRLTALRWPERELVEVPAARIHYEPVRPLAPPAAARPVGLIDLGDVGGRRTIDTALLGPVVAPAPLAAAAMEALGRFAVDPRWLIHAPASYAPTPTAAEGELEHPLDAFSYFDDEGVDRVVCEELHHGARAVLVLGRDPDTAERRFGVPGGPGGVLYARTGRPLLADEAWEAKLIERVRSAFEATGLWNELASDWAALECVLLPWSATAEEVLRRRYAAVGAAARAALGEAQSALALTAARGVPVAALAARTARRHAEAVAFTGAYRPFAGPVVTLEDCQLALVQVLAAAGEVHARQRDRAWHLAAADCLAAADPVTFRPTRRRFVALDDPAASAAALDWWASLTAAGAAGIVVRPLEPAAFGDNGLVPPALAVRSREFLRLVHGPEYTAPGRLERLRRRPLRGPRAVALRQYALGLEGLERFVAGDSLDRVHECVLGVLALEAAPLDPRL